jgi:2-polyprenyl-6-methoxyphenol hydroxylase-like FAD-dependent oxidoreductase
MSAPRVLVAGAGPVGLYAAAALARRGVAVTVLERREALSVASRASTFHPPTLEMLDELGIFAPLLPQGVRVDRIAYLDEAGAVAARLEFPLLAGATRFPFRWHMEQAKVTPALAVALCAQPGCALRFKAEIVDVARAGEGIRAVLADGASLDGDFLLACDGAHSRVRDAVGIAAEGQDYAHRVLRVITTIDLDHGTGAGMIYIHAADGSCSLLRMPGLWRVILRIPEGEDEAVAMEPARVAARVRRFLPWAPDPLPVMSMDVFSVSRAVARRYRSGRVLVLGDAAHVTNTRGGMNMNCGIHEAATLAGNLAAVLHGTQPDAALDAWAEARARVAQQALIGRTDAVVTQTGPALLARMAAIAADPAATRSYLIEASMLDIARVGAAA